jgi:hypothetical protein
MLHGYDPALPECEQFFPGDSELARRMRAFDWTRTDLGKPESWPQNLRGVVSLCLTSRSPILLWWGPNFTLVFNDACVPVLGESRHPRCLGAAGRSSWEELWEVVGPTLESVRANDGRAVDGAGEDGPSFGGLCQSPTLLTQSPVDAPLRIQHSSYRRQYRIVTQ